MEAIRDLAERDPNTFHRFLWANHLAYAQTYEVGQRFTGQLHPTRHLLLEELTAHLGRTTTTFGEVKSVLDVGCSLGYLLHHLERRVCSAAETLEGIDIDAYAIAEGSRYLRAQGSRVQLSVADMGDLDAVLAGRRFDLVFCAGVLMYLKQEEAQRTVEAMLRRGRLVIMTGLAHPQRDNRVLDASTLRESDGSFFHNIDRFVTSCGGRVVWRRYDGARQIEGNTVYFVMAERTMDDAGPVGGGRT
jgi:2-polyprenyl-3-methyl-5-hydroxy-6-metoxy-1,4-benzoquinol methylase